MDVTSLYEEYRKKELDESLSFEERFRAGTMADIIEKMKTSNCGKFGGGRLPETSGIREVSVDRVMITDYDFLQSDQFF